MKVRRRFNYEGINVLCIIAFEGYREQETRGESEVRDEDIVVPMSWANHTNDMYKLF